MDVNYHLELTPAQLKITHTALKSLLDDFGHEEHDVHRVMFSREVWDVFDARLRERWTTRGDGTPEPTSGCGGPT